jgi:hypothetical protein
VSLDKYHDIILKSKGDASLTFPDPSLQSIIQQNMTKNIWNVSLLIRFPVRLTTSRCHFIKLELYELVRMFFFYLVCDAIGTAATPGLLCQPRVIVKMIVESRWNVDWQGKPNFSEKTCPSATFVHQINYHSIIWSFSAVINKIYPWVRPSLLVPSIHPTPTTLHSSDLRSPEPKWYRRVHTSAVCHSYEYLSNS